MKVSKKKIDDLNIELTINIDAEDYAAGEKKKLAECRKTADFKGFRKGNVPMSLIQKVYGDRCLADAVNDVISEALGKFIEKEKLNLLGEPLGSEKQPEIEWVSGNAFKFIFDLAVRPEVNVEAVKEDTVLQYTVTTSAKEKEDMAANLKKFYEEQKEEKTDADIEKEVAERLSENYKQEASWRLNKDIRDYFVQKSGVQLPEAFLKRWLAYANAGKVSAEEIEKEFPAFAEDFKWQLVRDSFMTKFDLKIEEKDIREAAEAFVAYQYAMYGIGNVPQEMIQEAAVNVLNDQKQVDRLVEQVEDQKVISKIREVITLKAKKISSDKFRAL